MTTRLQKTASGLNFLQGLESDHPGKYWEVYELGHGDHRIWPQTQYLLYVTFKRLGRFELARRIRDANDFKTLTIDRRGLVSDARFCVLDNDAPPFYLAEWATLPGNFDEVALLGHYWALAGNINRAKELANFLKSKWNQQLGVLGMDEGDKGGKSLSCLQDGTCRNSIRSSRNGH